MGHRSTAVERVDAGVRSGLKLVLLWSSNLLQYLRNRAALALKTGGHFRHSDLAQFAEHRLPIWDEAVVVHWNIIQSKYTCDFNIGVAV